MGITQQKGVALIVSLLLLLTITLISVTSMQRSTLQERSTANLYERQLTVQQIESALRAGEQALMALPNPRASVGNVAWLYGLPVAGEVDRWVNTATVWANAPALNNTLGIQAQYIIEYLGEWPSPATPDCGRATTVEPECYASTFRITARTVDQENRASTIMQSVWRL